MIFDESVIQIAPQNVWEHADYDGDIEIEAIFEDMVRRGAQAEPRDGLHASTLKESKFCYRQCVLEGAGYQHNSKKYRPRTLMQFANGWALHVRWQKWIEAAGYHTSTLSARYGSEKGYIERASGLKLTIDEILDLYKDSEQWLLEIKGYNASMCEKLWELPKGRYPEEAYIQIQIYMYLTGIHQGVILVENKNNQDFRCWKVGFNPEVVKPYAIKLNTIEVMVTEHIKTGILPDGICSSKDCQRAQECNVREVCFDDNLRQDQREKMGFET